MGLLKLIYIKKKSCPSLISHKYLKDQNKIMKQKRILFYACGRKSYKYFHFRVEFIIYNHKTIKIFENYLLY